MKSRIVLLLIAVLYAFSFFLRGEDPIARMGDDVMEGAAGQPPGAHSRLFGLRHHHGRHLHLHIDLKRVHPRPRPTLLLPSEDTSPRHRGPAIRPVLWSHFGALFAGLVSCCPRWSATSSFRSRLPRALPWER